MPFKLPGLERDPLFAFYLHHNDPDKTASVEVHTEGRMGERGVRASRLAVPSVLFVTCPHFTEEETEVAT